MEIITDVLRQESVDSLFLLNWLLNMSTLKKTKQRSSSSTDANQQSSEAVNGATMIYASWGGGPKRPIKIILLWKCISFSFCFSSLWDSQDWWELNFCPHPLLMSSYYHTLYVLKTCKIYGGGGRRTFCKLLLKRSIIPEILHIPRHKFTLYILLYNNCILKCIWV